MVVDEWLLRHEWKVIQIIDSLLNQGRFAVFEVVLGDFLREYGVSSLQALGFSNLPILDLLYIIQQKISGFWNAYVGTQSVVSIVDFEVELVSVLNMAKISTLHAQRMRLSELMVPSKHVQFDTNEIELPDSCTESDHDDDVNGASKNTPISIQDFGFGSLNSHPLIYSAFAAVPPPQSPLPFISVAEFMKYLCDYICGDTCSQLSTFNNLDFQNYVATLLGADSRLFFFHHIGILVKKDLKDEKLAILCVRGEQLRRLAAAHHEVSSSTMRTLAEQTSPKNLASDVLKVELQLPTKPEAASLVDRVKSEFPGPYSPSFKKVEAAMRELWARARGTADNKSLEQETQAAAIEYVMLHIGSGRYRRKRIKVSEPPVDETVDETVDEAVDEAVNKTVPQIEESSDGPKKFKKIKVSSTAGEDCQEIQDCQDSRAPSIGLVGKCVPLHRPGRDTIPSDRGGRHALDCASNGSTFSVVAGLKDGRTDGSPRRSTDKNAIDSALSSSWSDNAEASFSMPSSSLKGSVVGRYTIPSDALCDLLASVGHLENDARATGRWGETLVFYYLLERYPKMHVNWVNRSEESQAPYDIVVKNPERPNSLSETIYIEVKTTRFSDRNVFPFSLWEWDFLSSEPRPTYHIYRVYNAGLERVSIEVIQNTYDSLQSKQVNLCMAI
jgi:hypothetical protein